jgi:hypothetical protein
MWPFQKTMDLEAIPFNKDLSRNLVFNLENKKKYDASTHAPALSQHIGLRLEDERGKAVSDSPVNFTYVMGQAWELQDKISLPFLLTVDLYGDTIFNVYQAPKLIDELKLLAGQIKDPGILSDVAETVRLLKKVEQHYYARFIGD